MEAVLSTAFKGDFFEEMDAFHTDYKDLLECESWGKREKN